MPGRMTVSGRRIGTIGRPARGRDRGKEQSDEAGTPLDEIGPGGKREAGGHPPLAARRPPNRHPPSEGPARARHVRPQLTSPASPDPGAGSQVLPRPATGGPAASPGAGPPDSPCRGRRVPLIRCIRAEAILPEALTARTCRLGRDKAGRAPRDCPMPGRNHRRPLTDRPEARTLSA